MQIEPLQWDTDFFGYNVARLNVDDTSEINSLNLKEYDFRLLYIFCMQPLPEYFLNKSGAYLTDEKLVFAKEIINTTSLALTDNCLKEINSIDAQVYDLAFQSGVNSRYFTDKKFINGEFKKLYATWIEKSIKKQIADDTIGYYAEKKLLGLITLKKIIGLAEIGLIAVEKNFRGQNIGSTLLNYATVFAQKNSLDKILVSTQGTNKQAINFYLKNGYHELSKTFVYHLWK